jgi:hypothetical protein
MNKREVSRQKIKRTLMDGPNELRRLINKEYPPFVTSQLPEELGEEIQVFMFHKVNRIELKAQFEFLKQNNYKTVSIDTFLAFLSGEADFPGKSVLLTFDDGEKSLYEVAYPLLQEYGFQAAAFVIPHFITDDPDRNSHKRMVSWSELREMARSGVVDVQSHSYYHDLIFTSPGLVDFYHPDYDHNPLGIDLPWLEENGKYTNQIKWGTPIYRHASRLSNQLRFLDNIKVREACCQHVEENGGNLIFLTQNGEKSCSKFSIRQETLTVVILMKRCSSKSQP